MSPIVRTSILRRFGVASAVAPFLLLSACTHEQPPPQVPMAVAPVVAPSPVANTSLPQDNLFKVSEAVRTKCNLPDTPTASPQFDLDDAILRPRGMDILDGIATCVRDGSLKGEGVMVTGHTDPRGSDSYNQSLGMRRADSTRDYLMSKGVASTDITVKSRGKLDATGEADASWQLDRRVEIDERNAVAAQ